jgi:hypothetical protein
MGFLSRLSLRSLSLSLLGLLLLPALALGLAGSYRAKAQSDGLDQARLEVDGINQAINQSISAPFYLSPRTYDPCNPETLAMVDRPAGWQIEYRYVGSESVVTCEWIYLQAGALIAVDGWGSYNRGLLSREYYRGGSNLFARDDFYVLGDDSHVRCFKQRSYAEFDEVECYSESGRSITIDPVNRPFSPIPPMLYWFSYR